MATSSIGAQMYTISDYIKTPIDIAHSCRRLRKIGYEAVQVSALGPIETGELAKILRDEGLVCAATHVSLDLMQDTNQCVEYHQALGCEYAAIGGFFDANATTERWLAFANELSLAAKNLADYGPRIGYHNHSHELAQYDGQRAMELLLEHLDENVWFEIDTYWIAHGGGDPAAWIDRVVGRIPCVHFKDMSITPAREQKMCEIGAGNLNWPAILDACKGAGVHWYLVERDSGDLDPFDSLQISLENMRQMGLQ